MPLQVMRQAQSEAVRQPCSIVPLKWATSQNITCEGAAWYALQVRSTPADPAHAGHHPGCNNLSPVYKNADISLPQHVHKISQSSATTSCERAWRSALEILSVSADSAHTRHHPSCNHFSLFCENVDDLGCALVPLPAQQELCGNHAWAGDVH